MTEHVFVSYSYYDKQHFVIKLLELFKDLHIDVSEYDGIGGDEATLEEQIRTCAVFVPVVSVNTAGPGWVREQTRLAGLLNRPIMPLQLTRAKVPWLAGTEVEMVKGDNLPPNNSAFVTKLRRHLREPVQPTTEVVAAHETVVQEAQSVHEVDDIMRGDDLVGYAVQAQIHRIDSTPERLTGPGSPIDKSELTRCLAGSAAFPPDLLRSLDDVIVAVGGNKSHIGGLAAFGMRMRELTDHAGVSVKVPPGWTRDIMATRSHDEIHVLVQASTLVNSFIVSNEIGVPREQDAAVIGHIADRLILLAGGPPTPRHYEAQVLLGSLAKYAFKIVLDRLDASIRRRPLGFRSWRSLTKLLMIARNDEQEGDNRLAHSLHEPLKKLAEDADRLRGDSINPGRSLDLELFIAVPWGWAGEDHGEERINRLLFERAQNHSATLRERGTAAMGFWQRAYENHRTEDAHVKAQLRTLMASFEQPDRDDIASGLAWIARTLDNVMRKSVAVGNEWPPMPDEPWYRAVMEKADELEHREIPDAIRKGTKNLFLHSLLQNAGVERRKAIDTLRSGGMVEPVAETLADLLQDNRIEPWLRVRVLFGLDFLQVRTPRIQADLIDACAKAIDVVARVHKPTGAEIVELQTALFAIGDVFGVTGIEDQEALERAGEVRDSLGLGLTDLVDRGLTNDPGRASISRALAYMLTFTAQQGRNDLSQVLLNKLRSHPDIVTRRFSDWALSFRFGEDHTIRPLLYALQRN